MPATPPTDPPTTAPTFVPSSSLSGADPTSVEMFGGAVLEVLSDADVSDVLVSREVVVLSSLVDDRELEDEEELLLELVSVVRARVRVPIVVGSESDVAEAVKSTETLAMLSSSRPDGAVATVLASDDAEPHPYWKKPPANLFW